MIDDFNLYHRSLKTWHHNETFEFGEPIFLSPRINVPLV
jgi:hypothetical protein